MTSVTEEQVKEALAGVMDPELKRSLVELGMVRDVRIRDKQVKLTLALTTLACPLKDQIVSESKAAVLALDGVEEVEIELTEMTSEEKRQIGIGEPGQPGVAENLNRIQRVIAVMSGKGGVGKSLVAGLLAVAFRREGHRVGILDADITGPSIPKMFGTSERPPGGPLGILPVRTKTGISLMSINLLLPNEDDAVIWRGPLISSAIKQFWGEVFWGELDYLIVDLPPGTSDASLTVMQAIPLSGVLLVTSPQDLAGMVVRKAGHMVQQMGAPLLGLVENMAYAICPKCGAKIEVFGSSKASKTARQMGIALLGTIPLDPELANRCDAGEVEEYTSDAFDEIADRLVQMMPEEKIKELSKA